MNWKVFVLIVTLIIVCFHSSGFAQMKKVGQSGMTYLAISLGARESAMGNASVANVRGVQSIFYNPAILAESEGFELVVNQVNWLADTKVYGIGAAYGLGQYGAFGMDLVYMDYGTIVGTERVDKSIDERGFIITGDLNIQDFAVGLAYAYPVNDRFSFGVKLKYVHEDLGDVPIAIDYIYDSEGNRTGEFEYEDRSWRLNHWGFDFGGFYEIGFHDLALAVVFQNYSGDMKYWSEAFQMPLVLRMGLSMDVTKLFMPDNKEIEINTAIDALHPIDYTERVHIGTEFVYMKMFAFRAGYKFNYDVENFSLGLGVKFDYEGYAGSFDYAYTNAEFFDSVNRISVNFAF
jgi:long-subunit fatty acid transport protein